MWIKKFNIILYNKFNVCAAQRGGDKAKEGEVEKSSTTRQATRQAGYVYSQGDTEISNQGVNFKRSLKKTHALLELHVNGKRFVHGLRQASRKHGRT